MTSCSSSANSSRSKSSVLVLSKEKAIVSFCHKVRAKFQDMYIFNELKLAIEAIEAHSANAKKAPLDAVILDCDPTISLRMINYVRSRPHDPKSSHLPLIAVIIMVSDDNSRDEAFSFIDYRNMVEKEGGAHVYINMQSQNMQSILGIINSVIVRKSKVDVTYQDLKQNHNRSKKVPYFPIFGRLPDDDGNIILGGLHVSSKSNSSENDSAEALPLTLTGATSEELFCINLHGGTISGGGMQESYEKMYGDTHKKQKVVEKSLIDPFFRPRLRESKQKIKKDNEKSKLEELQGDEEEEESKEGVVVEIRQLMNREGRVDIDHSNTTLGGINKEIARNYWYDSNNSWLIEDPMKRPETTLGSVSGHIDGSNIKRPDSSGGLYSSSVSINQNNSSSNHKLSVSAPTSGADRPITPSSPKAARLSPMSPARGDTGDSNSAGVISELEAGIISLARKSLVSDPKRQLKRCIKNTPLDLTIHYILEVDLSTRNISVAEREILEHGWKNELDGDIDRCTYLYTKAAAFLRESHLPKMFLANLNYKNWKYFEALKFYNQAIHKLSLRISGHYCVEDDFQAHFNRAVTKFRVGADAEGLIDLNHAISLDPRNLNGLELLKVIQRRLGQYKECFNTKILMDQINRSKMLEDLHASENPRKSNIKSPKKPGTSPVINESKTVDQKYDLHHNLEQKSDDTHLVKIIIPSLKGNLGLTERKNTLVSANGSIDPESSQGSLSTFKMMAGFKTDIHSTLFMKPSPLQEALLCPPVDRKTAEHNNAIIDTLRMVPYLITLSPTVVTELASLVEYRVIDNFTSLFKQNSACEYVVITLKGRLVISQENSLENIPISTTVSEFHVNSLWGHIDLLFHDKTTAFFEEMKHYVDEVDTNAKPSLGNIAIDSNGLMVNRDQVSVTTEESEQIDDFEDPLLEDKLIKGDISAEQQSNSISNKATAEVGGEVINVAASENLDEKNNSDPTILLEESKSNTKNNALSATDADKKPIAPSNSNENRVLTSQCYSSGSMSDSSEVLLISPDVFKKYIFPIACQDLKQRIECISASGLFQGWLQQEILRFARMGFVFTYNSGDVILEQRSQPEYLYFIMTGMVKAYKTPKLIDIISRKLTELKAKAERFDLKYSFHHKLRGHIDSESLAKTNQSEYTAAKDVNISNMKTTTNSGASTIVTSHKAVRHFIPDLESIDNYWDNYTTKSSKQKEASHANLGSPLRDTSASLTMYNDHTTISEKSRVALELEIKQLENKYQKALLDQSNGYDFSIASKTHGSSLDGSLDVCDDDDEDENKNRCEIATLQWPMIFGEDSVLDCDHGASRGSIIAETACKVFAIHKNQLQTFKIGSEFSDRVVVRMVNYPEDDIVLENIVKKKKWKHFRSQMMKTIPTGRWPKQNEEADPFLP